MSAKFSAEYDDVVEFEPWFVLCPKLLVRLCALSSLLPPPFADRPVPGICSVSFLFACALFSCGVRTLPMGVARLNLGNCWREGIESGGRPDVLSDMGGAAALFTGRAFGEGGIERPSFGTLLPDCWRLAPGIGGRRRGAGEAMSRRSGGG
jgi:hypothetical protein